MRKILGSILFGIPFLALLLGPFWAGHGVLVGFIVWAIAGIFGGVIGTGWYLLRSSKQ